MAYTWPGMQHVTLTQAIHLFEGGCAVYALYDDNTEALVEDAHTFKTLGTSVHYGIEK